MPESKTAEIPRVEQALGTTAVAAILGVHPRTLERRAAAGRSTFQVERERKLQQIWQELLDLYTPQNAIRWLNSAVPALGSRSPLSVMAEDGGLDRVLQTIGRMSWGIPD